MKKSESTRLMILQKAFELIYKQGYQSTSIDEIIATTKVTKGAFYYHFKTKEAMGLAIIKEILMPVTMKGLVKDIATSKNPLDDLYEMIKGLLLKDPFLEVAYGCPTGNLTQEMTPWNEKFAVALNALVDMWTNAIEACIEKAKDHGQVRSDVNAKNVTYFILSSYWGIRNFGKLENSKECYVFYLEEVTSYLNSLK